MRLGRPAIEQIARGVQRGAHSSFFAPRSGFTKHSMKSVSRFVTMAVLAFAASASPALAERRENPVAEFAGIDKITGRIITFDVYVNETVQFGALQVTPRVCFDRDPGDKPKTTTFVEIDEITLDRKIRRIFTGWMFAESPGLNAVDHAVYDVWLKSCKTESAVPAPKES
jgi:hypothetical protein